MHTVNSGQAFNLPRSGHDNNDHESYKTASGNLAFHLDVPTSYLLARGVTKAQAVIWPFTWCGYSSEDHEEISNKSASGNLAFHPVARTRLTERA